MSDICCNINEIRKTMRETEQSVNRSVPVRLMAVTKYVDADRINEAIDHGEIREIGENRPQELCEKYEKLHLDGVKVHMIGTLQTNKVKYIIDKVDMIHSLDSLKLAKEIDRQAKKHGKVMDCLIEVNIGREENKGGVDPDDIFDLYRQIEPLEGICVKGLMTVAPFTDNEAEQEKWFSMTKELFDRLKTDYLPPDRDAVLSMGMSDSFKTAIRCGSDIVRVGSSIFGSRPSKNVNKM